MRDLCFVSLVVASFWIVRGQITLTPSSPFCETIKDNALLFGGSNCFRNKNPSSLGKNTVKEHEFVRAIIEAMGLPVGYKHKEEFTTIRDSFRSLDILSSGNGYWVAVTGTPQIGDMLVGRRHMSIVVQTGTKPNYFLDGSKVKKGKSLKDWKNMRAAVGTSYLIPCQDNATITDWLRDVGDVLYYPAAGCDIWNYDNEHALTVSSKPVNYWRVLRMLKAKGVGFAVPYRRAYLMLFRYMGPETYWNCGELGLVETPPSFVELPPDCPNVDPWKAAMYGFWNLGDANDLAVDIMDPVLEYIPPLFDPSYKTHIFIPGYFDFKVWYDRWWGNLLKHTMAAHQFMVDDNFFEFHTFNSIWYYYTPDEDSAAFTYPNAFIQGRLLYNYLSFLTIQGGAGWENITIHAYGLGAVTAGIAGHLSGGRLGNIFAYNPRDDMLADLDPEIYGLTEKAAQFVSVIHTSTAYSEVTKKGHIDWYPNLAGPQPFCETSTDFAGECDMDTSVLYMVAGVQSNSELEMSCLTADQTCTDDTLSTCTPVASDPKPAISPFPWENGLEWPEFHTYLDITTTADNETYFCTSEAGIP